MTYRPDRIAANVEAAANEVTRLCNGGRWKMTIPAETNDSDVLISEALTETDVLTREVARLTAERDRYRTAWASARRGRALARSIARTGATTTGAAWLQRFAWLQGYQWALAHLDDDAVQADRRRLTADTSDLPYQVGDKVRRIDSDDDRVRKVTALVLVGPNRGHLYLDGGTTWGHGPTDPARYVAADETAEDAR
ncbi:hypothetical protein [Streptomonospora wellingtoniae]|uniref:DUF222 domain-containing protein n=1 Tax=Streptomonospora wellingtoniae TaxID=3075544 RepID=A0ABU2L0K0_9ACTN|nr:hypothetical protein [Streptomonospora sp. DSM 45055]MDT0305086.1 hypothetical protein [Streptomonospora sp. DSM 45055]